MSGIRTDYYRERHSRFIPDYRRQETQITIEPVCSFLFLRARGLTVSMAKWLLIATSARTFAVGASSDELANRTRVRSAFAFWWIKRPVSCRARSSASSPLAVYSPLQCATSNPRRSGPLSLSFPHQHHELHGTGMRRSNWCPARVDSDTQGTHREKQPQFQ